MKVKLTRYPCSGYTLMGPSVMILDLEEAADALSRSGFMREFLKARIKDSIIGGETFVHENVDGAICGTYRLATEQEVLDALDQAKVAAASRSSATSSSRKTKNNQYRLTYDANNDEQKQLYLALPRQARVVLDVLGESGRDGFSDASIEALLMDEGERLKTRQPPKRIFDFYKKRLVAEGLLEAEE